MYLGTQVHDEGHYEAKMVNYYFCPWYLREDDQWLKLVRLGPISEIDYYEEMNVATMGSLDRHRIEVLGSFY